MPHDTTPHRNRLSWLQPSDLAGLRGARVADLDADTVGEVTEVYLDRLDAVRYMGIGVEGRDGSVVVPAEGVEVVTEPDRVLLVLPYAAEQVRVAPVVGPEQELTLEREYQLRGVYRTWERWSAIDERQSIPAPTPGIAAADAANGSAEAVRAGHPRVRQTPPAPTPEIAMAEVEAALARGDSPQSVRVRRWGT